MTFESLLEEEGSSLAGNESICMAVSRLGFKSVWEEAAAATALAKLLVEVAVQK